MDCCLECKCEECLKDQADAAVMRAALKFIQDNNQVNTGCRDFAKKALQSTVGSVLLTKLEAAEQLRENITCPFISNDYPFACGECSTCKAVAAYDKVTPDENG